MTYNNHISELVGNTPILKLNNYVTKNQTLLFDKSNRFVFINDILRFNELLGPPTELIPQTTIELLTQPSAIYKGYVNGIKTNIQIHGKSIQFVGNLEKFNYFEFSTISVLMMKNVLKHDQPHLSETKANYQQFVIETVTHRYYQFLYPINSNLFEAIINLACRYRIMKNMQDRVKVDSSTLQWLMLNLAFVNAIMQNATMELRKAAIRLIYVVFTSFNFKHEALVYDVPNEDIPDNLLSYVVSISEDLAKNHPQSYRDFISEYLKLFQYIDNDVKHLSLCYLRPWIQYWITEVNQEDEFLSSIITIQKSIPKLSHFFLINIWENFLFDDEKIEMLMFVLLNYSSFTLSDIIISLAEINPKKISNIWVNIIMKKCIETQDPKIKYVITVISTMLASHLFDFESSGAELIYYTIQLKYAYSNNILSSFRHMYANMLHSFIRISEHEILYIDYADICEILSHESDNIFIDEDEITKWYSECKTISDLFIILLDDKMKEKLFNLFLNSMKDTLEPLILSNSLIFTSFFSKGHEEVLLDNIFKLIKTNIDVNVLTAISLSLSVIEINEEIVSKLFSFGIFLTLYLDNSLPLNLVASTYSKLKDNTLNLDQEIINQLIQYTKLPFDSKLCYSTFILFSTYCTNNTALNNLQILVDSNDNKYSRIYSLLINQSSDKHHFNFGKKTSSILTTLIMLLRFKKDYLIDHIFKWIKSEPQLINHINVIESEYFKSILSEINDPYLTSLLIKSYDKGKETNKIEKIIKKKIKDEPIKINETTFKEIVNLIFQ